MSGKSKKKAKGLLIFGIVLYIAAIIGLFLVFGLSYEKSVVIDELGTFHGGLSGVKVNDEIIRSEDEADEYFDGPKKICIIFTVVTAAIGTGCTVLYKVVNKKAE